MIGSFILKVLRRKTFVQCVIGVPVKIEFDNKFCDDEAMFGRSYPDQQRIVMRSDIDDPMLVETAIHEIIEHLNAKLRMKMDHAVINNLAVGLSTMLMEWEGEE